MDSHLDLFTALSPPDHVVRFMAGDGVGALERLGFRRAPGGVHLSKTMMLVELRAVMDGFEPIQAAEIERAVLVDNVLAKPTGTARRPALSRLNTRYGITKPLPIQTAALRLWPRSQVGRPMLALLCALAREPLLRDTFDAILGASVAASIRWPDLATKIEARHPGRSR
jgi:hypothetical protein